MSERPVGRSFRFDLGGATVTHVEDFANGTLCSNVTVDGTLHHLVATMEEA
ncbi:MoaF-related domain-containing protein [Streptomyces radicis]|uniref:MoaF-related domain-containing protein n=1 Tax=Streptomyces radicis TaxID=1750517 RepID=UPI0015FFC6CA|nr:hypothetical protein [Streptomyces radicis]